MPLSPAPATSAILSPCAPPTPRRNPRRRARDQADDRVVGILWFFAHQAIGVGNDVIMKYTGSTLGVAQVVFLRFAFATLTMLPVMLSSGIDSFKTDRIPLHIARSVLLAAGIALYCQGLAIAPIAVVTTLNFTIPLFTLVMARIFLKERVDATRWIGTLVGFAGVMVVVQPGGAAFNPMWLVVLVSAAMFASLDVLNKVFVGKESFWAMIFYTAFFTTLIAAVPAWMAWVPPSAMQLGLLAVLGWGQPPAVLLAQVVQHGGRIRAGAIQVHRAHVERRGGVGVLRGDPRGIHAHRRGGHHPFHAVRRVGGEPEEQGEFRVRERRGASKREGWSIPRTSSRGEVSRTCCVVCAE